MTLKNERNGKTIATRHEWCRTALSKALGLMFRRQISDFALIFEFRKPERPAMHNLFVFFPIDIICLNKEWRVLETKESFRPFTPYYRPANKCSYIIECSEGSVKKADIRNGDRISAEI